MRFHGNGVHQLTKDELILREIQRLHAMGRTPDDIATLIGANPHDIQILLFGTDAKWAV